VYTLSFNGVISPGRRRRRRGDLFKAEAIGALQQEGVSTASMLPGSRSSRLI
jgi:hypothetical protein